MGIGEIMKIFASLAILCAFISFNLARPGTSLAGDAGVKEVVATVEQGYELLRDLQADFSQRAVIASMKKEQRGSGSLSIKKSGGKAMFRFDYTKPRQLIVSNGVQVWFYLPENGQVMVSDAASLFEGEGGVSLDYLTGMGRISRDFKASLAGNGRDGDGNYLLELIPKKRSRVMARLRLTVAAAAVERFMAEGKASDPFPIVSSVVHDPFGNRTTIEFGKTRVNRGIGNAGFNFKIPAGVEVIKR